MEVALEIAGSSAQREDCCPRETVVGIAPPVDWLDYLHNFLAQLLVDLRIENSELVFQSSIVYFRLYPAIPESASSLQHIFEIPFYSIVR